MVGCALAFVAAPAGAGCAHEAAAPGSSTSADAQAPMSADAPDPLVGKPAPDFTATAHEGTVVHMAALKGKPVVLYFYPKDETPGCTKEACSLRDAWQQIAKTGAVLVGVSADTLPSHRDFAAHYGLPFLLVSDPDGAIGRLFGVPFEGHHKRQTIVVGPDGTVRRAYRQVDVAVHSGEILAALQGAQ